MIPLALLAAAAPTVLKALKGITQGYQAEKLQVRDTTPAAFKEALALGRQGAAAGLPGTGAELSRLDAGTDATLAAGARAGTSSQSVLGLLGATDASRSRYLADLATRTDADVQRKQRELRGLLGQQAAYQAKDQREFDQARAALREGSDRNLYGAVSDASQIAAYGLGGGTGGLDSTLIKAAGAKVPGLTGPETTGGSDDILTNKRNSRFGILDPTGIYSPSYTG